MSRLTGTDALNMMEAYNAVYAPQEEIELTEEQVQEDFENWVNSLVEEGHDLSEYTWEDMYEHYLNEAPIRYSTGPTAADLQRQRQSATKPTPTANLRGLSVGPGGFRINNRPVNPGMSPIFQRPGQPVPARPVPTAAAPRPAVQAPARPVPTAAAPAARPAAAPAGVSKPAPVAAKPTVPNLPGLSGTGALSSPTAGKKPSLASQAAELRAMQAASRARQGLTQSFDVFDVVKGHLLDEGYADTEEAALQIMANMSEEWRTQILEQQVVSDPGGKGGKVTSGKEYPATLGGQKGMKFTSKSGKKYFTPDSSGYAKASPSK